MNEAKEQTGVRMQRGLSPAGRGQAQGTPRVQKPPRHKETTPGSRELGQPGSSGRFSQVVALVGNEAQGCKQSHSQQRRQKRPQSTCRDGQTHQSHFHPLDWEGQGWVLPGAGMGVGVEDPWCPAREQQLLEPITRATSGAHANEVPPSWDSAILLLDTCPKTPSQVPMAPWGAVWGSGHCRHLGAHHL